MQGRGKGLSLRKCQGRMRQHFKTGEGVKKDSLMLVCLSLLRLLSIALG